MSKCMSGFIILSLILCSLSPLSAETWAWATTGKIPGIDNVFRLIQGNNGALFAGTSTPGKIFTSTDKGAHWRNTGSLPAVDNVLSLFCAHDGTIYAGTTPYGTVFKTTDGGEHWAETAPLDTAIEAKSIAQTSDGTLFVGTGDEGKVFRSDNAGESWEETGGLSGAEYIYSLLAASDGSIYAGGAGRVFVTHDGGGSWHETGAIQADQFIYCLLEARDGTIYAGGSGRVYRTIDNGEHWADMGRLSPHSYGTMALVQDRDGEIYATSGTDSGIYRLANGNTWIKVATLPGTEIVYALLRARDGNVYASGQGMIFSFAPLLSIAVDKNPVTVDEPFAVPATVQRIPLNFDAYLLINGESKVYSFTTGDRKTLTPGVHPFASNVAGLPDLFSSFTFSIAGIPASGNYTITIALTPHGKPVTSPLFGYTASTTVNVLRE